MNKTVIEGEINRLASFENQGLYLDNFFLTWDKTVDEIKSVLACADILRMFRRNNISPKIFDSGLGISIFRDKSTRTRFSFVSACNFLGLTVQDFEESKSQVAHGETVRETANMISFMAQAVGIRDDMYIGKGHTYMKDFARYVSEGFREGVLEQCPTLVNLQCDIDHPTQTMADTLHLVRHYGGAEKLAGKKVAMTWAYSPSYGKPLSVPQGVIGLMTRFGMDVVLAHPKGYEVMPEVEKVAAENAKKSGGSFTRVDSMAEAFDGADVVYPKSWAPFEAMKKRTDLYGKGDFDSIDALEKELLKQNSAFQEWECTEKLMERTRNKEVLYLHCLPADITGVSCENGEVEAAVFDRFRAALYKQAGYKPYIIAAMIFLSRVEKPADTLMELLRNGPKREIYKE